MGLPQRGGIVVQPEKKSFLILVSREHFLKISSKSVDDYHLLAFTRNKKKSPKTGLFKEKTC